MRKLSINVLWKLGRLASFLCIVCLISFLLVRLSPLDPVRSFIGAEATLVGEEQRLLIEEKWGLNAPILQQFGKWFVEVLHGNFGISMIYNQPVLNVVLEKLFASILLIFTEWLVSGLVGFLLGMIAGIHENKWIDKILKTVFLTILSAPVFWLAIIIMMIFAVWLGWFPVGLSVPIAVFSEDVTWMEQLMHMILPCFTLSITGIANIAMYTRGTFVEIQSEDYILYAKARGESKKQRLKFHEIRNALIPSIMFQFGSFSELLGASLLVEQIFSYPGLGKATVDAGLRGDAPLLLGCVFFSAIIIFAGNLAGEIIAYFIDPRVREKVSK
ncbi:peptide/nickel transport system permease protein [Clostridium tetanomorphum]|uniref:ABC transporter permease n=1 Tax=Clostridium tetanomorphum TaxID=1553 RepID=UPI000451BE51|nr:ABC transporter permease [Clostridium tetanomorphum]KAJ49799.1 peptide ABC transporter permease [Clostridium tetanomorphum DSM 665]MBP1865100.1 peptide/nickel transport system permease protein [Clostridium tetanomorphum]NRS84761.1 peptide/nickel transport system permease protein [Clostridium tetanomorphum]SQB91736.1 dipeptide transport system permease protein dppB [Clostridium tetanomorphum]